MLARTSRILRGGVSAGAAAVLAAGCVDFTGVSEMFATPLLGITVSPPADTIAVGDTASLAATGQLGGILGLLYLDRLSDATWGISDPARALLTPRPIPPSDTTSVAQAWVVGRQPGTVTVTARARGKQGDATITITPR